MGQILAKEIRFYSTNAECSGSLYLPDQPKNAPVIIMAHGLGGLKSMRLPAFAEHFVAAGYACFLFDYRHFGESGGEPRQLLDIAEQLADWKAAVNWVRQCAELDSNRIILWGSSFSGGHVLEVAAQDDRIAAVISQCPFTDGLASSLVKSPIASLKLSALAIQDRIAALQGKAPVMVALAGRQGEVALMDTADAYEGYMRLMPSGIDFKNYVAARFALDIIRYFPGRKVKKIVAPILFCICQNDSVAPAKPTLKYAQKAKHKEIISYPYGHFDIYVGDAFAHVVSDQLNFLQRTIPV